MSYVEFIAGCNAGILGVLVGHPFDTIKVKLQSNSNQSVKQLLLHETPGTLYRGISSPLLCLALINAIVFGAHAQCVQLYSEQERDHPLVQAKCGFVAGAAQTIITSPMELIRNRMQTQAQSSSVKLGLKDHFKQIVSQSKGIRSLYRGYGLTFTRDSPAFAVYFGTYEWMLQQMAKQNSFKLSESFEMHSFQSLAEFESIKSNFHQNFQAQVRPTNAQILMAGGLAGMVSWLVVYPIDVLKTQVQLGQGANAFDCFRNMYHRGGLAGISRNLCRGLFTTLFRAFPVNAASFFAYDLTVRQF